MRLWSAGITGRKQGPWRSFLFANPRYFTRLDSRAHTCSAVAM